MSNNQLVGLPTSLQRLNKLEVLNLDRNKLRELPAGIGDLIELRNLSVSNNQLVDLPTSMQKLGELEKLNLCNNKLTELPAGIGDLKELSWLYVSGNPLNFDAIRFAQKLKNKGKFINTDIAGES